MMPIVRQRNDLTSSPLELFLRLPAGVQNVSFLLSDGSPDSRWSILAWNPVERQSFIARRHLANDHSLPFVGGGIGVIDFEYSYQLLDLPFVSKKPLVEYQYYDDAMVYDHHRSIWYQVGSAVIPTPSLSRGKESGLDGTYSDISLELTPAWDFSTYQEKFNIIHDHIRSGEIYQACLTFPFFGEPLKNPRHAFASFSQKNPACMSAYLELSDRTILSLSPERFFRWDGETIDTKPIKGTRPRSVDPVLDDRLRRELLQDEKEKAELHMITDLLRNDLSKVCVPGSVKVLEHQALQQLPKLWHTYSHIVGKTKEGIESHDLIQALFPGGSISGCPKRRAVELLSSVEQHDRGIYTGSIGYISDNGVMDQSIAIRTIEQTSDRLQCSFGSGIVFDSTALSEYEECLAKSFTFARETSLATEQPSHQAGG